MGASACVCVRVFVSVHVCVRASACNSWRHFFDSLGKASNRNAMQSARVLFASPAAARAYWQERLSDLEAEV
jgi:hypothetical protein